MPSFALNYRLTSLVVILSLCLTGLAQAQFGGGGGGTGGGTGQDTSGASGVAVDANGVLRRVMAQDATGQLAQQRVNEALQRLDGDLAKPSKLRKVSLTRLEKMLEHKLTAGSGPDDAMQALAGLTRIDYVFCYPDSGDVVIAGPAEPWGEAPDNRLRGLKTGRPVLELQDLIVALRTFAPAVREKSPVIYCSIDPTAEGLSRMQQFLLQTGSTFSGRPTQDHVQFLVSQLQDKLGPQVITVGGVSPKTHFAQVLVEADYRMKLIGIGLERPPVRLVSYVDRANPAMVGRNALQRWYFVPDYQCLKVSEDGLAMEIMGEGVKLVGEDEVVQQDGSRKVAGGSNRASQGFVDSFTKVYPKLAAVSPVYAQLRNCVDLAITAAYIQHQDFYGQTGWDLTTFGDEAKYPVETLNAPEKVASAVNGILKGSTIMTPIGGGVQMEPTKALESANQQPDDEGVVSATREQVSPKNLNDTQWWWD